MRIFSRLNGWQRLWLVLTALALIFWGLIYPYHIVYQYSPVEWQIRYSLMKDLESPLCTPYVTKPLSQLPEPKYEDGGGCYHIHLSRRYGEHGHVTPYTLEIHDADRARYKLSQFGIGAAIFSAITAVGAGVVYLAGLLIAWIRRGFAQPA